MLKTGNARGGGGILLLRAETLYARLALWSDAAGGHGALQQPLDLRPEVVLPSLAGPRLQEVGSTPAKPEAWAAAGWVGTPTSTLAAHDCICPPPCYSGIL